MNGGGARGGTNKGVEIMKENSLKIIETFWTDLLIKFEKSESEDILQVLEFVEKEVLRLNAERTRLWFYS